ncbi:hypothetical protein [Mucilaginibacter sp. PPCGB 2223]|uniref:hypothetical protein n=1 Tax=Mucilaginibacter sp. PPCGB 2223 TaxID=1886027 RepID=UPI0011121E12|nr:hypothetical protein [Mucilaginibacter sp. PPCGB 2223]
MRGSDSSYLITTSGKRIDAATIDVKPGQLTVDGKPYPLNDVSSIRSKKMYFGVSNGMLYQGESVGRINVLYDVMEVPTYTPTYGTPGYGYGATSSALPTGHTTTRKYYIQKRGSSRIDKMTVGIVADYVADNPEALAIAKGAKRWKAGYLASFGGIGVGAVAAFASIFGSGGTDASGRVKEPSIVGPGIVCTVSLVAAEVSYVTYNVRMIKAIEVYNR